MKRLRPNYTRLAACTLGVGLLMPIAQRALATDACDPGFIWDNTKRRVHAVCTSGATYCSLFQFNFSQ